MEIVLTIPDGELPVVLFKYFPVGGLDVELPEEDEKTVECEVAGFKFEVFECVGRSLDVLYWLHGNLTVIGPVI